MHLNRCDCLLTLPSCDWVLQQEGAAIVKRRSACPGTVVCGDGDSNDVSRACKIQGSWCRGLAIAAMGSCERWRGSC